MLAYSTYCGSIVNHEFCREAELVKRAKGLVVNSGMASDADLGPVISKQVCLWTPTYIMQYVFLWLSPAPFSSGIRAV